jgi:hypothetical protein
MEAQKPDERQLVCSMHDALNWRMRGVVTQVSLIFTMYMASVHCEDER